MRDHDDIEGLLSAPDVMDDLRRAQEAETRLTHICARLATSRRRFRCFCYALSLATAALAVVCCVAVMG